MTSSKKRPRGIQGVFEEMDYGSPQLGNTRNGNGGDVYSPPLEDGRQLDQDAPQQWDSGRVQ